MSVHIQERGWGGHFIAASKCLFRRNTRISTKNHVGFIIGTVGNYCPDIIKDSRPEEIGYNRHYETMVFHCDPNDRLYHDADVSGGELDFEGLKHTGFEGHDNDANLMHDEMVKKWAGKLDSGDVPTYTGVMHDAS